MRRQTKSLTQLLESDEQPSVSGYSPANHAAAKVEMAVPLPTTDFSIPAIKTELRQQPEQQKQQHQLKQQQQKQEMQQKQEIQQQQQSLDSSFSKRDGRRTMLIQRVPRVNVSPPSHPNPFLDKAPRQRIGELGGATNTSTTPLIPTPTSTPSDPSTDLTMDPSFPHPHTPLSNPLLYLRQLLTGPPSLIEGKVRCGEWNMRGL